MAQPKTSPPAAEPVGKTAQKRALKREAVLTHATRLFNLRGIAATTLADVAEAAGLKRAALYYYVDDRAELVFQCYRRACEQTAEDLALAIQAGGSGLDQVLAFVRNATAPERPDAAVLSEISYLDEPHRGLIETADRRNGAHLTATIAEGITDGSIRSCDARIVAHAILGMLSWAQLSPHWVSDRAGPAYRRKVARELAPMIEGGVGLKGAIPSCPVDAETFLPGRFNAFDRDRAAEMKTGQLLMTASQLFNRQGIEATSLDDISAALGATKGVVYHYMQDKTDLVVRCYERAFDLFDGFAEAARRFGPDGHSRSMIGVHLNCQAQIGELSPLMPQAGLDSLPSPKRNSLVRRANALRQTFAGFMRQGIADGSVRTSDVVILSQLGAGAFAWLPKWVTPEDRRRPRQIADEIVALFTLGLMARTS